MVAQKRGRGGRNQPARGKAAAQAEEPQQAPAEEVPEAAEAAADDNNGDAEPMEQVEDAPAGDAEPEPAADGNGDAPEPDQDEGADDKKEDKVETGKLLVENLPSSYLFDYQEKLKELFSKHGEIVSVKRGPILVTELTTTPTLSAIIEFKNKESVDKALAEGGRLVEGRALLVGAEPRADSAVLVGVPYEASTDYVRLLFTHCGDVAHIHEFSKTKYKILRVTFNDKESVEKALKLDRELRINGFLVTVSKYRDDDEQKAHNANSNKNKRQHSQQQNRNPNANTTTSPNANRNNSFRPRGGGAFNARGNFRGGRGRGGFGGRGGAFPRGGFAPVNTYIPPQPFMGRPGGFMDGQRPNKRLRQM